MPGARVAGAKGSGVGPAGFGPAERVRLRLRTLRFMSTSRASVIVFYSLLGITSLLLLWLFSSFLAPAVLAMVLFVFFHGLNERLVLRLRGRRRAAAVIMTTLIVLLVIIPLSLLTVMLATQAHGFYLRTKDSAIFGEIFGLFSGQSAIPAKLSQLLKGVGVSFEPGALAKMAADTLTKIAFFLSERLGNLAGLASDAMSMAVNFCIAMTIIYALFVYGADLRAAVRRTSPLPQAEADAIVSRFEQISRAVFVGNGVASLIQGTLVGVGFWLFDAGPAALFGAVSALLAFLPLVGASLIFLPAAVVLCFTGPLWVAVLFLAYNIVVSVIIEYWLKSKLIGGEEMNPVLAFLAIIAGIQVFGIMGLFYGPLIVTMFLAFINIYQTRYRTVVHGPDGDRVELTPVPVGDARTREKVKLAVQVPPPSAPAVPAEAHQAQTSADAPGGGSASAAAGAAADGQ